LFKSSEDPWLFDLDWESKDLKMVKNGAKSKIKNDDIIESIIMNDQKVEENPFYRISSQQAKSKVNYLI
jgi:hypothetical protein